MPVSAIIKKELPVNPSQEQLERHVRYMQQQIELMLKPLIDKVAALESRVEELEGT
jgi:predicted nuclease with TOPRIM domain